MPKWLTDIWNAGADILGAIKAFIFSLIDSITSWIGDIINWAESQFVAAFSYIQEIGDWAGRLINDSVVWLQHLMTQWINDVYKWASQAFNDARDFISYTVNGIVNWVKGIYDDLRMSLKLIYDWILTNVWNPLYSMVQDAWHFATVTIPHYVKQITDDIIQWITDGVKWIWKYLSPLVDFFTRVFWDAWKVIEQAWDWITFFATHPISMGISMVEDIVHGGFNSLVSKAVSAMESEGSHVMDIIAKYLSV